MSTAHRQLPDVSGVISDVEIAATANHLATLQLPSGMIPWFPGGHCDPWNHVESAMALDVAGRHDQAASAYRWLADVQLPSGAWHNYYTSGGAIEDDKLDTNVCAYLATGLWHHALAGGHLDDVRALWPTVERALTWVLAQRRDDGMVLWAVEADGTRRWDYCLLTGTSSIAHALHCGARLGELLGTTRPAWAAIADDLQAVIADDPGRFEPKERWAMDWYYPVLTGAVTGAPGKERLADGWSTFVLERDTGCQAPNVTPRELGVRCVSDEPWVTASETAECAIAYNAIGETTIAADLLRTTRRHRLADGSYYTGIVYPDEVVFPFEERTSYTAAAVILAADAIAGTTPASSVFTCPTV